MYVINSLDRGGAELGLAQLVKGGLFEGCDLDVVTIVSGRDMELRRDLAALGASPTSLLGKETMKLADIPAAAVQLHARIRDTCPDIVIGSLPQANIIGRLCAALTGVPVFVSFEHNTHLSKRIYELLFRLTSMRVDWSFADCASTLHEAHRRLYAWRPPKTSVVPLIAFPPHQPRRNVRHNDGVFRLVNAGRFTTVKNQSSLIEAAGILLAQGHNVRLTLYGDGPKRASCIRLAQEIGIADYVSMPGLAKAWWEHSNHDLFVLVSKHEGQCLAVLEAMYAGIPVLATRVGGVAELCDEGALTALPSEEPAAIAHAIARLIEEPGRLDTALSAEMLIDERFSAQAVERAYAEINAELKATALGGRVRTPSVESVAELTPLTPQTESPAER